MKIDLTFLQEAVSTICDKHLETHSNCLDCSLYYCHCGVLTYIENEVHDVLKGIERAGLHISEDDVFID